MFSCRTQQAGWVHCTRAAKKNKGFALSCQLAYIHTYNKNRYCILLSRMYVPLTTFFQVIEGYTSLVKFNWWSIVNAAF